MYNTEYSIYILAMFYIMVNSLMITLKKIIEIVIKKSCLFYVGFVHSNIFYRKVIKVQRRLFVFCSLTLSTLDITYVGVHEQSL